MGFIDLYKRLEKLCGEILDDDRRVSAYIDEMTNMPKGTYLVRGWEDDLKQLKHYRWVRNQIVHNPDCTEENMCDASDTQWLADFYSRIINETDPLTLYRKATQPKHIAAEKKIDRQYYQEQNQNQYQKGKSWAGCGIVLLIAVAAVALIAIVVFVRR